MMKTVRYTADAAKDLRRHRDVAPRIRKAMGEYAEVGAHANDVTQLVGSKAWRMRVGDFRVIFENGPLEITVTRIGPRGDVYD